MTEKHRAVSRKAAPPGSEPQWRLWEERTEHREHGSSSQNTEPQGPGGPPVSHMTLSPSCAHLPSRSLFTSRNCGTTESHNSSKYSKTNTKKQVIIFMIQKSWEETCSIKGRGWFHKGLGKLSVAHRPPCRTTLGKSHL